MKKFTPFLLLFFALNLFSQKEANFWYFGRNAALDFNSGTPVPVSGSKLNTTEGCSSFSDENGNLLFYVGAENSDARSLTIWDKNNNPMPNGTGLKGDSSSAQSALTIPAPGKTNIYYLFTLSTANTGGNGGVPGFFYYEIDMSLNGNLGDINTTVGDATGATNLSDGKDSNWTEKVTAVKGNECNSYWVISLSRRTSASNNNEFYAYKVTNTGVDTTNPVISEINNFRADDPRGYLKVSPDGTKLVAANMSDNTFLFNFDNETGRVTNFNDSGNPRRLSLSSGDGYGVEFSPSSARLYVSTGDFDGNTAENLYQFDLSLPTFSEINSSRTTIFSYFNSRSALQLGPDGKIYWSSEDSNSISVINNPNALGKTAVNYSHRSVSLGAGASASQGLPPFISSLLLPVEIKDSDTNELINNQNLEFCIGDNKTIIPENITGNNITHEWFFNDSTTPLQTTKNLTLTNLSKSNNGKYELVIKLTDDCGNLTQYNGTFNIGVFEKANATTPLDLYFCDTDRDGFNTFNLQDDSANGLKDQILTGLDKTIFDVIYFLNAPDAGLNNNPLPNPYTNPTAFSNQTIYARVQNKNAPNACPAFTSFTLAVTDLPIPVQAEPYRICDDIESGSDTDGIINTFLLKNKDDEIFGTLDKTQYNISYHTTEDGAENNDTNTIIDKNINYAVTTYQRVFVRIENKDNSSCFDANTALELIVDPLPIVDDSAKLIQCHNNPDLNTTVNLKLARPNVSSNYENETFEYYKDQTETQQIADTDIETYPVTGSGNKIWVKTISNQTCSRISKLIIDVNFSDDLLYTKTYEVCDDFLDKDGNDNTKNSDIDGISAFDFSDSVDEIKGFFPIAERDDLEVSFYETENDRIASINPIPDITNHRNNSNPTYKNTQIIYVKIINKNNNGCSGTAQFTLTVKPVPLANTPDDFILCDDEFSGTTTDGQNSGINLRSRVDQILGSTQTETDYIVSFHTSAAGAKMNTDIIINDTDFTNEAGFIAGNISEQTIYVRVQDRNGPLKCVKNPVSFKIIVNPIPAVSNTISPFAVCDIATSSDSDTRNRIAQNIDLTSKDSEILAGKINHRVAYYATQQDAQDGNEIANPTDFQNITSETNFPADFNTDNPGVETIFFKVFDLGGNQCESIFATFQLLIYPEPNIPINISDYSDCDNTSDSFANDANGINGDITLKNKIPEILANYQPAEFADFSVTFYTSLTDAESGNTALAIDENIFENDANNQTIYVRVENTKNTPIACVNTKLSFNINIKSLPSFTVMGEENIDAPQIVCLNDTPLTLEAENPAATYDYIWTNEAGTTLGNNATLQVTTAGKYTVIANDQSPDGCSRERTIVVNESNIAKLLESFITIIDESNNLSSNDNISISIDTLSNDLGPGDYQFALKNDDNQDRFPSIGFQDEPLFENLEGGIYTIIVNDKNGCSPDTTLQISVIQFPKFFTPNGDGKNDTWGVKGANKIFYPNSSINIFNRFGKLVAQVPIDSQGWNGTYNGKTLPSDDYWFNIQLIPADTSKSPILKKGHFSLLRR